MIDERLIGNNLEGSGRGLIELLIRHFSGMTEENKKISVRIGDVPARIRTDHLPNTGLQRHLYSNLVVTYAMMSSPVISRVKIGIVHNVSEAVCDSVIRDLYHIALLLSISSWRGA
jgi:hypothetical protein